MLKRTERLPTKPSGSDMTFFKDYIDELLFKLDIKHVESVECTPEDKPLPANEKQPQMKL